MRDTAERVEPVKAGTVKLVGTNKELIVSRVMKLIENQTHYNTSDRVNNPNGDGNACKRVVNKIILNKGFMAVLIYDLSQLNFDIIPIRNFI